MDKLEKVIKGMERCSNDECNADCPYYGVCYVTQKFPFRSLFEDAIALLKAQEPRVIKNLAGNGICPGCGYIIPAWSSPNYCGYCGQAVKWK